MYYPAHMSVKIRIMTGVLFVFTACTVWASGGSEVAPSAPVDGVVVNYVWDEGAAAAAGIQEDDRLVSWERLPDPTRFPDGSSGVFTTPFDLMEVILDQAPRGTVVLSGVREGKDLTFTVPAGDWGLQARPVMPESVDEATQSVWSLVKDKQPREALAAFEDLLSSPPVSDDPLLAAWITHKTARYFIYYIEETSYADSLFTRAREMAAAAGNARLSAMLLFDAGVSFKAQKRRPEAETMLKKAADTCQAINPGSLVPIHALVEAGRSTMDRKDYPAARVILQKALTMAENEVPGSYLVAECFYYLGKVGRWSGELDESREFYTRALELYEALRPISLDVARCHNDLGLVARKAGHLKEARRHHLKALAIKEQLVPDSMDVAGSLNNLGVVARHSGDFAAAEEYYRRSLEIKQKEAPGSLEIGRSYNNLGIIAWEYGELARAKDYYARALEIFRSEDPAHPQIAKMYSNLGLVSQDLGLYDEAEEYYNLGLALARENSEDSIDEGICLYNLGNVATARADFTRANELYRQALDIIKNKTPDSNIVAYCLNQIGDVAYEKGDFEVAEDYFKQALTLRSVLSPGTLYEADSLHGLGNTYYRQGKLNEAAETFRRAIEALEIQEGMLKDVEESRAGFRARFLQIYHDYMRVLVEQGRSGEAFNVLERSRARMLLTMLAEKDLVFADDIPEALERERRELTGEYDSTLNKLSTLSVEKHAEEINSLHAALRTIQARQEDLRQRIREASPNIAALRYPESLTQKQVVDLLAPSTLLLSYSLGLEETLLFAVGPGKNDFEVHVIPRTREELHREVRQFRSAIQSRMPVESPAARLSQMLIQPVSKLAKKADRILVSPDGPLHFLPFNALEVPGSSDGSFHYLVEEKPIYTVVSMTVYNEITRRNRGARTGRIVAFGDPFHPTPEKNEPESTVDRSGPRAPAPLPSARQELAALKDIYPERARLFTGKEATEENVKTLSGDVSYLHFACHGMVDERFPLNSALMLSTPPAGDPDRENGILQAWEIFESVRVNADLVTLSACETGLGKEIGGEGLIGLTRAFQYAGARSIVASLWRVDDEATANLMISFYRHLKAGVSKAEALRRAQVEMIQSSGRDTGKKHPFFWAGFQLYGHWE